MNKEELQNMFNRLKKDFNNYITFKDYLDETIFEALDLLAQNEVDFKIKGEDIIEDYNEVFTLLNALEDSSKYSEE